MLELLDRLAVRSSGNKLYRGKNIADFPGAAVVVGVHRSSLRSGAGAATLWCCGGGVAVQCVDAGGGFRRFSASLSHRSRVCGEEQWQ